MMTKLSKLLALLLCLMLPFAALAEMREIQVEPDESYASVDLGENYAFTFVPADWMKLDTQYADETSQLLGAYASQDGLRQLMVTYTQSPEPADLEKMIADSLAAGLDAELVAINGILYFSLTLPDAETQQTVRILTTYVNEELTQSISFTYTFPTAEGEAMLPVMLQGVSRISFYE